MSNPTALVILAEGAEEMETVIVVNVLRRGKVDVTLASIATDVPVTCSRGVKIVPDCSLEEALDGGKAKFDAVVLPGNHCLDYLSIYRQGRLSFAFVKTDDDYTS